MSLETKIKKLSDREHVLMRPSRYVGAITPDTINGFTWNNEGEISFGKQIISPAFIKLFDEIISNSADFSKTKDGKHLNKIDVNVHLMTGVISVSDNGGIPVVKHKEYGQYIPDMIYNELRTGTNFEDDAESTTTGQNGEGAALTQIFSKWFRVFTSDGKNSYERIYTDNGNTKGEEIIKKSKTKGTTVEYIVDESSLGGVTLDKDHYKALVRRTHEIAACNIHIAVTFNGKPIKYKTFHDFTKQFSDDIITFGNDDYKISVYPSSGSLEHFIYVNSSFVGQGGTIVDYILNPIVNGVREHILKKTKQDVRPSDIKNHFVLMVDATINNPRYNSQTKERLETLPKDYGTSYTLDDKTLDKIIKSPIVSQIIDWAENKALLEELKERKKIDKDNQRSTFRDIEKYEPANEKENRQDCTLFICEGDSAANPIKATRNPKLHGVFPLRGKIKNVKGMKLRDIMTNKEVSNLSRILGLPFGDYHLDEGDEWYKLDLNGEAFYVNINDEVFIDGKWIKVKELL